VIAQNLPQGNLKFEEDGQFLAASIRDHVSSFFRFIFLPQIKAVFPSGSKVTGRLVKDEEINEKSEALTEQIVAEIGPQYRALMCARYFGDDVGMVQYVYTRVRDMLMNFAVEYNETYHRTAAGLSAARELEKSGGEAGGA